MKQFKTIVEKNSDGYVAYPLGLKKVIIGQADTYGEAPSDVKIGNPLSQRELRQAAF